MSIYTYSTPIHEIVSPTLGKGGLYLGSIQAAKNHALLKEKGIECVVSVMDLKEIDLVPESIKHLVIPADDVEEYNMRQHFEKTNQYIENNLQNTNVLVHCETGVSNSTTIVMAYLMNKNRWNFQKIFKFVSAKRPIIGPNSGFILQLIQYQQSLKIPK